MPGKKRDDIVAVKELILVGQITTFEDIFKHLPVLRLKQLQNTHHYIAKARIQRPWEMTVEQIGHIADYLQVDEFLVYKLIIRQRRKGLKTEGKQTCACVPVSFVPEKV